MNRKILIAVCAVGIAGAVLLGLGFLLGGKVSGGMTSDSLSVEPFRNVEISVMSADIYLETGEEFSVEYNLHGREKVKRAESVDGTFYFSTGFDPIWKVNAGNWELTVTIPEEMPLENLHLSTSAGDIIFSDREFSEGILHTAAGEIRLDGITAERLEISGISGEIALTDSQIGEVQAENTSSDILLEGEFGTVSLESVSGSCEIRGKVQEEAFVKTMSGKITAEVPAENIFAESHGGVTLNDAKQGRKLELTGKAPALHLESVSGPIRLTGLQPKK